MILYAVYIIDSAGVPMLWEIFQEPDVIPEEGLLSPLLSSIQFLSGELTDSPNAAEKFQMKSITYHFKNFGEFIVVMVTNSNETPKESLNKIGWNFLKEYGSKIHTWNGKSNHFSDFMKTLKKIVNLVFDIDSSQSLNPTKRFTTKELFYLEKELKDTAYAITALQSASAEEIANESDQDIKTTVENLERLQEMGYLGVQRKENGKIYFF